MFPVTQNPANRKRFGKRLHCTDDLIALPKAIHQRINAHYNSKERWTHGLRIRDAMAKRSWREQYEYGLEVLRDHGVEP